MNAQEQALHDTGFRRISFKDSPGIFYQIRLLSVRENMQAFAKATSLMAPLLTITHKSFADYQQDLTLAQRELDEGLEPINPVVSLYNPSLVLSEQIVRPEFQELVDMLTASLTINGIAVNEDTFRGSFDKYLKIVEWAFKENLYNPLVSWLGEKGWLGMISFQTPAVNVNKDSMNDK
jgi:hypothetical protein